MKEIIFPDQHEYLLERDMIEFPAVVGGNTIACRITLEEIAREFGVHVRPDTFEERFRQFRPQIEERAKDQIRTKQTDDE